MLCKVAHRQGGRQGEWGRGRQVGEAGTERPARESNVNNKEMLKAAGAAPRCLHYGGALSGVNERYARNRQAVLAACVAAPFTAYTTNRGSPPPGSTPPIGVNVLLPLSQIGVHWRGGALEEVGCGGGVDGV